MRCVPNKTKKMGNSMWQWVICKASERCLPREFISLSSKLRSLRATEVRRVKAAGLSLLSSSLWCLWVNYLQALARAIKIQSASETMWHQLLFDFKHLRCLDQPSTGVSTLSTTPTLSLYQGKANILEDPPQRERKEIHVLLTLI